jgi:hypothetical protein
MLSAEAPTPARIATLDGLRDRSIRIPAPVDGATPPVLPTRAAGSVVSVGNTTSCRSRSGVSEPERVAITV